MASNFHDMNGLLVVGFDWHLGVQMIPIPTGPFPFWEINAVHPFWAGPDPNNTVLINGTQSVKDGHEPLLLWPHFPLIPFNMVFPLDVLFGSQKCWIPKLSVHAEGKPMTTTIFGPLSANLDCHTPAKLPTSFVLQAGTVETTPAPIDLAWGIGRMAVNAAVDYFFYRLPLVPGAEPTKGWGAVSGDILGRFLPNFSNPSRGIDAAMTARFLQTNVLGGSPQGAVAAMLDHLNVSTGAPEVTWVEMMGGPTNVGQGNEAPTAVSVGETMLENLFPPLKLLPSFGEGT